jgi:hypothetical protein
MKNFLLPFLIILLSSISFSQQDSTKKTTSDREAITTNRGFSSFSIRGYTQVRYNRLLETNPDLGCEQCDKSWGEGGGFFLRRIRLIFYGQIGKQVYFYIQPDIASDAASDKLHFGQLRDAYMDIGFDEDNEFRLRIGQSKIPYGFENMQSSSNRLPLDRHDGLNSAVKNERDLGVFFYWAPKEKRELFSRVNREGLKGSGDYGVFGLGVYNGQTANSPELNDEPHVVARFSYPFEYKDQIIEMGVQAYTGKYVIPEKNISEGVTFENDGEYIDERIAASFILYPKPFGILAEYNVGRGPEFNKSTNSIDVQNLHGGHVTLSYRDLFFNQVFIPFVRMQYYDGGKKHERDARSYTVKELELGLEWQPSRNFELVVQYTMSNRRYEDFILNDNHQIGNLLRLQAQVNY